MIDTPSHPLSCDPGSFIPKDAPQALDAFLGFVESKNLSLYPSQEEAILALFEGQNLILNTPTGSGKSLVAMALHYYSHSLSRKSVYTSPVKALVNEKFLALCRAFGPHNVGLITGDASVNPKAPILCCTAEILANIGLREGHRAVCHDVVMDEFHYYGDRDRGMAWQIPLLTMPQCRFLLMSATLGDTSFFAQELTRLNGKKTQIIRSVDRPVPLEFTYAETPLLETIQDLLASQKAPVYLVNFSQQEAIQNAQNFMSLNFTTKEDKKKIQEFLIGVEFTTPFGKEIRKFLSHGIGLHHGGLLPRYRILVESLAQKGLLKIISGTDTLGVGVNIPIRTVLITQLCKYDGQKTGLLSVRDFHQIAGRAGRKGFDTKGWVVVQAPAHAIENLRLEMKAKLNPKKKWVRAKPPTKGYVHYSQETFDRLISSEPERLESRFALSYALLIQVLGRTQDGCRAMKDLLRRCHESPKAKAHLLTQGMGLFRGLLQKKIVEWIPKDERIHSPIRVNGDFQKDFSLTEALGLFLLDCLVYLDPMAEDYALSVLTLTESILENPQSILKKQQDALKKEKLLDLKAAQVEYEERVAELEKIEYPKPMADVIYGLFNRYGEKNPWVDAHHIRPKSIAREMFEHYYEFNEYIRLYGLERVEGILLRYLSGVYRILSQTVPDHLKNDDLDDITAYLHGMLQAVDDSIFDEWKKLQDPAYVAPAKKEIPKPEGPLDLVKVEKKWITLIRNRVFLFVRAMARGDLAAMGQQIENRDHPDLKDEVFQVRMESYRESHGEIRTDSKARAGEFTRLEKKPDLWVWEQTLLDTSEHRDSYVRFGIPIPDSLAKGEPVIILDSWSL
jgi:superfamily II RNA helicase